MGILMKVFVFLSLFFLSGFGASPAFSQAQPMVRQSTVAHLPAASAHNGEVIEVLDGLTSGDCSTGAGTFLVHCSSNGTTWAVQASGLPSAGTINGLPVQTYQSTANPWALGWLSALHNAQYAATDVVWIGDSIERLWLGTAGAVAGPTHRSSLPPYHLADVLQGMRDVGGSHGTGLVPITALIGGVDTANWTVSGTYTTSALIGPTQSSLYAGNSTVVLTGSNTASMSQQWGDTVFVYWADCSGSATFTVSVDGVSQGSFGATTSTCTAHRTQIWTGWRGNHTMVITGPSSGNAYIYGAEWTVGSTGISVHDVAVGTACIGGKYIRQSLKTRDRADANRRIVEAEERGCWDAADRTGARRSIVDAIAAFLEDAGSLKGRELAGPTLGKYRTLLGRLQTFCSERSLNALDELTTELLRTFRETWPTGPRATGNNICRLKAFFKFCLENDWIPKNPALALRGPKHFRDTQKLPFTETEMQAILAAARYRTLRYSLSSELETLILLMRHTGLRISDAALLKADRIVGDQLQLYTQKTGSWVSIPLQPNLLDRLKAIEPKPGGYLFVSGSTRLETVTDLWRRKLKPVFEAAGIPHGHPHRFRHTFAVDLLSKGVDIKSVSLLLSHASVTITEKFYAAWITARQQALSDLVRRTWPEDRAA